MAVTRRVADLLYAKRYDRVLPAFAACMLAVGIASMIIAGVFCVVAGFSAALSVVAIALFMVISMTWLALTWLSVVREYDMVLRAYIYGTMISVIGMVFCLMTDGTVGILAAYTAGQAFTLMILIRTIVRGMQSSGRRDFTVFASLRTFPRLVAVGLFYNAAIWVDKMIFWFRDGEGAHALVQSHPLYDTCCFLAYLTVVPALAVNLIRLETSFYETYRAYYGAILSGTPLRFIEDKRDRMFETLKDSTVRLLRVQGAITVLIIIFAPYLIEWLELQPIAVRIFRLACLGAFFNVMLLITILMQLYFDLRLQAAGTSLTFLLLNAGFAWWSVDMGESTYGVGYATAAFLSLLLGYSLLHRSLGQLDYLTFTGQPIDDGEIPLDNEEEEAKQKALSAEAAEAEMEDECEEAPVEVTPISISEAVDAPKGRRIELPDLDPVLYPVPLRDVLRIARRQQERAVLTTTDLPTDPFSHAQAKLDRFTKTAVEEVMEELAQEITEFDLNDETLTAADLADDDTLTKVD